MGQLHHLMRERLTRARFCSAPCQQRGRACILVSRALRFITFKALGTLVVLSCALHRAGLRAGGA
jgi:hypothetical protein